MHNKTEAHFTDRVLLSPAHMGGGEMKYIQKAFDQNWIVPLGPNVDDFEKRMEEFLGDSSTHAVAMVSGTAAIHIALKLIGLKPGEEVFCSSATFAATANPIAYEQGIPVFIDSEESTWNMCPKALTKAIEAKKKTGKIPRVLIAVDLFGMSADYKSIQEICRQYNIILIADAAESLGSTYHGQACGTFGDYGVLSFNGNKIITTSGGGMLLTHKKTEKDKAIFLITQARDKAPYYLHSEIGFNYRLSNVSAGIGLGQMEVLSERVNARRRNFDLYRAEMEGTPMIFAAEPAGHRSNRWLSTALIRTDARMNPAQLIEHLHAHNVEARRVWKPLHTQPVFNGREFFAVEKRPVSEKIFDEGICLPSGSSLKESDLKKVCQIMKAAL